MVNSLLKNRYRIIAPIAEGGFGAVYRAEDTTLQRACAVKVNLQLSAAAQAQFRREASLLAGVNHRALPRVTDHFEEDGRQYLVMDFVAGESLAAQLGKVDLATAIDWTRQVAAALDYLHRQTPPIFHRDIKPANIIVQGDGTAMLVDFGIAKVVDSAEITRLGAQAVTAGYSPPEQYNGTTDARSDVYALGATLFALLTGDRPADALDRLQGTKIDISALPTVVKPILGKAMALAPHERYATMGEFVDVIGAGGSEQADFQSGAVNSEQGAVNSEEADFQSGIPLREGVAVEHAERMGWLRLIFVGIGAVVLVVLGYLLFGRNGGEVATFGEPVWTITDGIESPAGLGADGQQLYVSADGGYHIVTLDGAVQTFVPTEYIPSDVAVLSDGRVVSVGTIGVDTFVRVLDGEAEVAAFGRTVANGGLFTPFNPHTVVTDGDAIFVLDTNEEDAFASARVYQFDADGDLSATLPLETRPFVSAMLGIGANGELYVAQAQGQAIEQVGVGTVVEWNDRPIGVTADAMGDIYVLVDLPNRVLHFSADGELLRSAELPFDGTPRDIVYVADLVVVSTRDGIIALPTER